jgi:uncharacterized protein (DUF111 family)
MATLYLDCAAGISGDMAIGAFLDLGLDTGLWERRLALLGLSAEYELRMEKIEKYGEAGVDFDVVQRREALPVRRYFEVVALIEGSGLSLAEKRRSLSVLEKLGRAQAAVHGIPLEEAAFHEPGALDTIVDVVGACIAVEMLGPGRIVCSPVHTGCGSVCHRGWLFSVPAPATAFLLRGVPCYGETEGELTTPTGAAIAVSLAQEFGESPAFLKAGCGTGFGKKEFGINRGFRVFFGEEKQ